MGREEERRVGDRDERQGREIRLSDVLRTASRAYYGGERERGGFYDTMPCIGLALGLIREGAGPDENRPDVAGAVAVLDGYIERLRKVRDAVERLARGDAGIRAPESDEDSWEDEGGALG
jgi:hypothetical protein